MSTLKQGTTSQAKHVSRACLECRSRHVKCGGQQPICERCEKRNKVCLYVKSHRGGSRKKGVSTKDKVKNVNNDIDNINENDEYVENNNDKSFYNQMNDQKRSVSLETDFNSINRYPDSIFNDSKSISHNSSNKSNLTSSSTSNFSPESFDRKNHKSDMLPCVKNGMHHLADDPNCTESCLNSENFNKIPPCMKSSHTSTSQNGNKKVDYYPVFNDSKETDSINKIFDDSKLMTSLDKCYISPSLIKDINVDSIVSLFYNSFYNAHPFLPSKENIHLYLDSIPYKYDLLLAMKIIGEGQNSSKYARDVETINFLVSSLLDYIRQIGKDFLSLQSLLLLAMITHISSLHDLSNTIRDATISLALEMKLNFIDQTNVSSSFLDVNGFLTERNGSSSAKDFSLNTPSDTDSKNFIDQLFDSERVSSIPREILLDTMRKTFWELYYFDSISGTASGHTKSRLAMQRCLVLYPTSIPLSQFDYKSRAEACKLVNDSISLNIAIQSNNDALPHLNHMRAALGNWEMKLSNPDTFGMPYLINKLGIVNDGVFEAIMLINYARIFTYRPFSYLWREDVSKHPRCTDEKGVDDPCVALNNKEAQNASDSRKIIETRKTIDSANFLVKALLDTDPSQTCKRTPFLACALAFSCLVHLSAYAWIESNLSMLENLDEGDKQISASELDVYTEYIKLEIGSTLQISRHWSLSAKLITHIAETLLRVSPKLYKKVQAGILGLGFNLATITTQTTVHDEAPIKIESTEATSSSDPSDQNENKTFLSKYMISKNEQNYKPTENSNLTNHISNTQNSLNIPDETQIHNNIDNLNNTLNNSNNNFMLEFADLVNGMGGNGNSDSVLGFPPEPQDYEFLDPLSPTSDTGCDWVDKHDFIFDQISTVGDL